MERSEKQNQGKSKKIARTFPIWEFALSALAVDFPMRSEAVKVDFDDTDPSIARQLPAVASASLRMTTRGSFGDSR